MNSNQKRVACISMATLTIMALLGLCVCTLGPLVLREQRKQVEQVRISEAARSIREGLYIPADAVVLDEVQMDDLLAYAPGCTGTVIEIAYGVNRPFDEVLTDYHQALLKAGWKLHPGYRHQVEGFEVYKKSLQVELSITNIDEGESTLTTVPSSVAGQFHTIYTVMITYTEPSNIECIG